MQLVISCIASHEDAFRKALGAKRNAEVRKELAAKRRMLQKSENRLAELDRLFKRIYEDTPFFKTATNVPFHFFKLILTL